MTEKKVADLQQARRKKRLKTDGAPCPVAFAMHHPHRPPDPLPTPQSFDDTIPAASPDPPNTATPTTFFSRTRYE